MQEIRTLAQSTQVAEQRQSGLGGHNGEYGPKGLTAELRHVASLNPGIGERHTAEDLHERSLSQHGGNLRFAIMGDRQRIALPALPFPECRGQREL